MEPYVTVLYSALALFEHPTNAYLIPWGKCRGEGAKDSGIDLSGAEKVQLP
jgi:hypothetical protein